MNDWIYDIETYPNAFTATFEHADAPLVVSFEISDYRDDRSELLTFLDVLRRDGARLVGFNNVGFDYPVLHQFIRMGGCTADLLYAKAQAIITAGDDNKFAHLVKPSDYYIPQVDLYRIHHFDNRARATSLKALEFNMRAESIQDLPFPVGIALTREQVATLREYNAHDVSMTKKFYHLSKDAIAFREELSRKYGQDFINKNDTAIGKSYFVMELEKRGVACYDFGPDGRRPRQTPRPSIALADAILPWITFQQPEFQRILSWFKQQTITETKGVFKDIVARVNDFDFVFGLGGIHGSISNETLVARDDLVIESVDVVSMYPNIAIKNRFYPEHLGPTFCDIYQDLYEQRAKYPKGSAENAMLKLALNGTFGDSNSPYSVFYDPLMTLRITITGQLTLCMLAEGLMSVPTVRIVMANTDGLEYTIHPSYVQQASAVCEEWEKLTQLTLERARYNRMWIRDVNNYIGEYVGGGVKRKGAYEYDRGWHQDASALIVPKVVEMALVHGANIRQTVEEWPDVMDFMLRVKVPRSGKLQWGDQQVQNITRYLVTTNGKPMTKWLPPTKTKPDKWRPFAIEAGRLVTVCNEVESALFARIDHEYYIAECEKLIMGLK